MNCTAEQLRALIEAGEMLSRFAHSVNMPMRYRRRIAQILEHYPLKEVQEQVAKGRSSPLGTLPSLVVSSGRKVG